MKVVNRVCNLCEAMCGLIIHLDGDSLVKITGDKEDVFSKGAYCPKSQGLKDLYEDQNRLRKPLKKTRSGFVEISWKQVYQEVSAKINQLQKDHGNHAIATYVGNPNVHNLGAMLVLPMLLRALRSANRFSATSVDQLPHMVAADKMFGHSLLLPIADIDRTDFMLILGANPVVSNGSLLSASGIASKLKSIVQRGGKVTVIDPRYTETASQASEHHFIKPGQDLFLLVYIIKTLLTRDLPALPSFVDGWHEFQSTMAKINISDLEAVTGITTKVADAIADDLLHYKKSICYGRMGVSTQEHGTLCQWLINVINLLTGNTDCPGGVLFTKPAIDVLKFTSRTPNHRNLGKKKTRVRSLPSFDGEFPVAALAEEILTPGEGQVKGLITVAGNPIISTPNGQQLKKAIGQLDLFVAIDYYQTETTSHADYILPPCSPLERSHYDLIFNALAIRNTARYSPPVISSDGKSDFEIILNLWQRLHVKSPLDRLKKTLTVRAMKLMGTDFILDYLLKKGPYKISLRQLKAAPSGIDFGELKPSLPKRLFTANKKLNLAPELFRDQLEKVMNTTKNSTAAKKSFGFQLIGRRHLRSNNSWMHNCQSLRLRKKDYYLLMNQYDASRLNVNPGDHMEILAEGKSIQAPVRISDKIMAGTVSLPHGWGHVSEATELRHARTLGGSSINDVISEAQVDEISGNAVLNGQWVDIKKVGTSAATES